MDNNDIVRELDALISQLVRARGVLTGIEDVNVIRPKRGRPPGSVIKSKGVKFGQQRPAIRFPAVHEMSYAEARKGRCRSEGPLGKKRERREDVSEGRSFSFKSCQRVGKEGFRQEAPTRRRRSATGFGSWSAWE